MIAEIRSTGDLPLAMTMIMPTNKPNKTHQRSCQFFSFLHAADPLRIEPTSLSPARFICFLGFDPACQLAVEHDCN
ncbi:MAG: hypothetical protein ACLSA6_16045 [Holdemania massiliensis]